MNLILGALPEAERLQFERILEPAELVQGTVLFEAGSTIDRLYFVDSGIISLVCALADGVSAEITTVGREGFVNVGSLLDDDLAIARHTVQVPGKARCIAADRLRSAVQNSPILRGLAYRYAQALIAQISQSVACNATHGVEERMARWLLMTHDRSDSDELMLTQEFIAQMLAVRRPTVSLVARTFQTAGLIRYRRGRIKVEDRQGLEETSCECYGVIRQQFRRLLPEADLHPRS